jgi:PIN domain nuclease of toxin-antitoxin system
VLLWAAEGRLQGEARAVIERDAIDVLVSAATVWEIEIKRAVGRIRAPADIAGLVDASGFERLAITFEHAREAGQLPLRHGDPFDRMLIAQARVEGLVLATADDAVRRYDVPVLEVARG